MSTHRIGLFPAEKEDDPMWKDRVEHAKDVWALYPGYTAHLTVRCMSAMYRLQGLRGAAMSQLMGLVESTKITLDNREDLVVDLSTELVEKDLQVEQMANHIQELEDQVEARENTITIEVLEDQLQNTQQQLEEANQHLDLHHQEIEDMEAEGANEDVDIEGGKEPEPASSLDTAGSGRPPSPESSVALFAR
jgi:signal recognition particle GTPase